MCRQEGRTILSFMLGEEGGKRVFRGESIRCAICLFKEERGPKKENRGKKKVPAGKILCRQKRDVSIDREINFNREEGEKTSRENLVLSTRDGEEKGRRKPEMCAICAKRRNRVEQTCTRGAEYIFLESQGRKKRKGLESTCSNGRRKRPRGRREGEKHLFRQERGKLSAEKGDGETAISEGILIYSAKREVDRGGSASAF